jgi:hypothetical protein
MNRALKNYATAFMPKHTRHGNRYNPLTLLHKHLERGTACTNDEECLEIATSIREVMAECAERMADPLKDEAKLTTAVTRLPLSTVGDAKETIGDLESTVALCCGLLRQRSEFA